MTHDTTVPLPHPAEHGLVSRGSVNVFLRGDVFYAQRSDRTTDGIPIAIDEDVEAISAPAPAQMGTVAIAMLSRSTDGVRPLTRAQIDSRPPGPLLALAGVSTWRRFIQTASAATVERHPCGCVEIRGLDDKGRDGMVVRDRVILATDAVDAQALGQEMMRMLGQI